MRMVLACAACVAACAGDAPPGDGAQRRDTVVRARADTAPVAQASPDTTAFAGTVERVEGMGNAGLMAVLDGVRTARHPGFERVVFEFRGDALPDYSVEYSAEVPTQCGSGAAMHVAGAAHLVVRMSPAQAHAPVGGDERSTIASRAMAVAFPSVRSLTVSCDFEGVLAWIVGVDARRAFRVTPLRSPARLAIDIGSP